MWREWVAGVGRMRRTGWAAVKGRVFDCDLMAPCCLFLIDFSCCVFFLCVCFRKQTTGRRDRKPTASILMPCDQPAFSRGWTPPTWPLFTCTAIPAVTVPWASYLHPFARTLSTPLTCYLPPPHFTCSSPVKLFLPPRPPLHLKLIFPTWLYPSTFTSVPFELLLALTIQTLIPKGPKRWIVCLT